MNEQYLTYYSHHLNRNVEMLIFGHWGYPVLVFPTTLGRYYQAKDHQLVAAARPLIEQGKIKLYCVDSIDADSWYGKHLHPSARVHNANQYYLFLHDELVPWVQRQCNAPRVAVSGCSFGGYHAANFAFRYPYKVSHLFTMGAAFDIRMFMDGYYDNNVYFNNPPDYLPQSNDSNLWNMDIVLGTCQADFCRPANERLSSILSHKNIRHWLDIRGYGTHDWPVWRDMFPQYLSRI
ncbi:esterase family protein [Siphonobacter sp. SORGH_AS_0500]|uniref:esterase family protein n=1 Tax=Siphonobacter sp. SORGH_AS_0500 TaxID=1864824 RepID=UPI000CBA86D7|nr:alpha/beta fold hydrolase [Siphonobacter sp. SORGH_AS_0500]MDR6195115.1 esterase/lipase superfamily enzyme [Siphonobacter sp. SORGH_AS_0500]PKK38364.1 esterase [Siphonobacter sp. SORGH_AS_0500]